MVTDLKSLRIDRSRRPDRPGPRWAARWIIAGVVLLALLGIAQLALKKINAATEVDVVRVAAVTGTAAAEPGIVLNATGYIIAAHRIQVASKVIGRVSWIGVEKGDRVKEGQIIVRLEDDEYRAQLQQAQGQVEALEAKLAEMVNGSRPEEIAKAEADVAEAKADLTNARITLDRTRQLVSDGVLSKQALDDAKAKYDSYAGRVAALDKTYALVKLGPRKEQIDAVRGQIVQARGVVAFAKTQLDNTVIHAPVTGTILERAVEKGEFLTTSFVGDRGAKGYVVSLADLNDLQVELDINQNDFAKLGRHNRGTVTTDAFPDRKYDGEIYEISPEANRQKATVQVKVKILKPDDYLRPEMNATVAFLGETNRASKAEIGKRIVVAPESTIRNGAVFVVLDGRAVRRAVKTGASTSQGVRIEQGLIGGEDVIANPPDQLKDGDRVQARRSDGRKSD